MSAASYPRRLKSLARLSPKDASPRAFSEMKSAAARSTAIARDAVSHLRKAAQIWPRQRKKRRDEVVIAMPASESDKTTRRTIPSAGGQFFATEHLERECASEARPNNERLQHSATLLDRTPAQVIIAAMINRARC